MNRIPSRRLAVGLGAVTLAAGGAAAVAALAAVPAASASDSIIGTAASSAPSSTSGGAELASAPEATSDADNERCELALPAAVLGDPHVTAGAAAGLRVWHDASGWHLRATHPGHASITYTGTVRSGQPITAHPYELEAQDRISFSRDHRTMTFRFVDHGGIDGVDLTDRCADHTSFSVRAGGRELPTADVYLGANGTHPGSDPFTISRRRP